MRTELCALTLISAAILSSCQKEVSLENPVGPTPSLEHLETKYLTLGTWDERGRPNYLLPPDNISTSLTSFISSNLPEQSYLPTSHPELFSTTATADIVITKTSDVFITYIYQGVGRTSTIAFYTYPTNQPPKKASEINTITYVFPNAGNVTPLEAGDKVKIGRFNSGTAIGFVLLQSGWDQTIKQIDNKAVHFYSTDILNPEPDVSLRKHVVAIKFDLENKVLIGFEHLDRTKGDCDHDFNDVMFYATVTP